MWVNCALSQVFRGAFVRDEYDGAQLCERGRWTLGKLRWKLTPLRWHSQRVPAGRLQLPRPRRHGQPWPPCRWWPPWHTPAAGPETGVSLTAEQWPGITWSKLCVKGKVNRTDTTATTKLATGDRERAKWQKELRT